MNEIKRVQLSKEIEDPFYLKDPKLLEIYKKSLPPKESYYYFPKGEEIIIYNNKKPIKSLRRVFYNVPLYNEEKQWINEFKQLLNSHPELKLPDFFEDYFLLYFIYASNGDYKDSIKRIKVYLDYNNKTFPMPLTPKSKVIEILNKGFFYCYGRDHRFRPIVVCQADVFQKFYKEYQTEELMKATAFLLQYLVNNLLVPGKFETWIMIINLSGVSIISLPEPLKRIIPELSDFFLCRLYKNYIIGLNFITRILYKIAVNFIDKVTAAKITVLDKKKDPKLFEEIRRDNIEEKFGGTAPNLPADSENGYFPPRMPSQYYIKEEENINDILVSEEEYINKYERGEIPEGCISPFIYDKLKEKQNGKEKQKENKEKESKISEDIQIKKSEVIKRQLNMNKAFTLKRSKTQVERSIKDEENEKMKFLLLKKIKERELMNFLYHGWQYDNEISISNNHNSNSLNNMNILDDINKLGRKKQKFFSKVTSIKGKK